jgi:hypothetical protein
MKRLFVLGSLLAIAACAPQPPPPPAATAPPPVATAPPPQVAEMPPPAPPPPVSPVRTSFNGVYTGSMTQLPSGQSEITRTGAACEEGRPVRMRIANGYAYISYFDYRHHKLHYRGIVHAYGHVAAYHLNGDGSHSVLGGRVRGNTFTGNMTRGPCSYAMTLARR